MTRKTVEYLVFEQLASGDWGQVGSVTARGRSDALGQLVGEEQADRAVVAVPAAQWSPVVVEREVKTTLKLRPAGASTSDESDG